MNVLILQNCKGRQTVTNRNLFSALDDFLSEKHSCRQACNFFSPKKYCLNLGERLRNFFWADIVILHTYCLFSLDVLLLSKIFGKSSIVFAWDEYPVVISGFADEMSASSRFKCRVESFAQSLVTNKIVPTGDFKLSKEKDTVVFPLWPSSINNISPVESKDRSTGSIKVAFAGNINVYRGLESCIERIDAQSGAPIEIHIFSNDRLSEDFCLRLKSVKVVNRGFIEKKQLAAELAKMNFGLISLNENLEAAAFPSKIFDYVGSSIPVLYYGPKLTCFVELLESSGVGCRLSAFDNVDFNGLHRELSQKFPVSSSEFYSKTKLRWDCFDQMF